MLAVNGQYGRTVFLGQAAYQSTGHHKRLLVGQANGLVGAYCMYCRRKTCKTHHGREHHVYWPCLNNLVNGLSTCIYLYVWFRRGQRFQPVVMCFVGYHHCCRLELDGLLGQLFHLVVGRKTIHLIQVAMFLYHFKSLGSDGTC